MPARLRRRRRGPRRRHLRRRRLAPPSRPARAGRRPRCRIACLAQPTTIETVRALGALDQIRLPVLPLLVGSGRRLTPEVATDTGLQLQDVHQWPAGVVELTYAVPRA